MTKEIWIQTRDRKLAARAIEEGFTRFLLEQPLAGLGRMDELRLAGTAIHRNGARVGDFVVIRSRDDEHRVRDLKGKRDLVVVDTTDWKVIPLENLIAALAGQTRLYAVAHSPKEAELFLTTLERGVDGVVVRPKTIADLRAFREVVAGPPRTKHRLVPATITRIEPVGLGERVCVDTCNLFEPGEGMLVGSSSRGFFLVAAECYESEYVAARPFRVNAGALHAYLLVGDKTQYLSEVRTGQRLEAVRPDGERREVVVGRAKIETRPLVLVEAEAAGQRYSVILQNAETIRLTTPRGAARSVAKLKIGDKVLVHAESGARHFGMKVEERIREQ